MADDDNMDVEDVEGFGEDEAEPTELDDAELDEDVLEEDALEGDDEFPLGDDESFETVDDTDEDGDTSGPTRRSTTAAADDDDDDDDLTTPDDVEADLDTILKDRLVAADDEGSEDDDEEPEDRNDTTDRIQPKRADEELCPSCFLLVRRNAPMCPVGDDECPLFHR